MDNNSLNIKYDRLNDRLVYLRESATSEFWENQWLSMINEKTFIKKRFFSRSVSVTKKYLPRNSRILEGGCGLGLEVNMLANAGFSAIGIDFAQNTISRVKELCPQLILSAGDVTSLPFKNDQFDGYWSFGVIEHFFSGYSTLQKEAFRVLKPGGFLFLAFPAISPLRRFLINKQKYDTFNECKVPDNFYQFALNPESVISELKATGFIFLSKSYYGSIKGIKDSFRRKNRFLHTLNSSSNKVIVIVKILIEIVLAQLCGHTALVVLRKLK